MTQMIDSKVVKWNSLITDDGASYRVSEPEELVELQHAQWDTLIDKLQQRLVHDVSVTPLRCSVQQAAFIVVPPPGQTGRQKHCVLNLFIRLSICWSVTRLVNTVFGKWMNRVWCQLPQVVDGQGREAVTWWAEGLRSHKAEIGHRNPFHRDVSRTIWQILTTLTTHYVATTGMQRSRSDKAVDRFGGVAEASFLTSLGWVAFLVL